tara:strand:+ start:588 stop:758 length:171 start_codon:yes stop_codon:yes gene_type:complete
MASKQTSFFLMLSAFIVAAMITYLELNRKEAFNQKCKSDSDCADGLKCSKGKCTKA